MSTPIPSVPTRAVRSAEVIFAGPEVLHARNTSLVEQATFHASNQVEGR